MNAYVYDSVCVRAHLITTLHDTQILHNIQPSDLCVWVRTRVCELCVCGAGVFVDVINNINIDIDISTCVYSG